MPKGLLQKAIQVLSIHIIDTAMTTIPATPPKVATPYPYTGTATSDGVQTAQTTQSVQAAGSANGRTGLVPAEVGQNGTAPAVSSGKPTLSAPKASATEAAQGPAKAEPKEVGTARQRADAKMDRADMLREMRKDRREAVCAKAFELDDFARLVVGPIKYCVKNPVKVLVGAVAVAAATATALSTGSLVGFVKAMPAISPMIAGFVKSSGVNEMLDRGVELALLTLGVDPKVSEKWGDVLGSAMFVGVNVAMNALGDTWAKIDMSNVGELAADVAVLLNVPTKNAAALGKVVDMVGTMSVGIGVGIANGDYNGLTSANFKTVWETMRAEVKGDDPFNLANVTGLDAFKAIGTSWNEVTQDYGNFEELCQTLTDLATPQNSRSTYKA